MGVGLRADVQRVRHRVGIQRAWIEDRDPGRGHREDRLPPGPRPGPDEDRRTPAGTSRPARLWRRRVQRRGRRASVPRPGRRAARPVERRYIADVGRLQPAADGERDPRHGSPRRRRSCSERAHPLGELLARLARDGASLFGVRDGAMTPHIRALVFDFDGLILETEMPAFRSWAEIYREHGHELPRDRWLDYIGREAGWFDALA